MILQKASRPVAEAFHRDQFKQIKNGLKALDKCPLVDVTGNIILQKIWDDMAARKVPLKQELTARPKRQMPKSIKSLPESEDSDSDDDEPPKKKRSLRSASIATKNQFPSTSQKNEQAEIMDK